MKSSLILIFFVAILLCVSVYASDVDIRPVNFRSGMPLRHDSLNESFNSPSDLNTLKINSSLLSSFHGKFRFKIVGFSDNQECHGPDCISLSLRRATYVRNWLLANGVPVDELDPAEGRGTDAPLDSNESSRGRLRNRRVEINPVAL